MQTPPRLPNHITPRPAILLAVFCLMFFPGCYKAPEEHARIARDNRVPIEKRLKSVQALNDQFWLAYVATSSSEGDVVEMAALEKLTDQEWLANIASAKEIRFSFIKTISKGPRQEKKIIEKEIIKRRAPVSVAEKAIERLTDQSALKSIAADSLVPDTIRHKAVARITADGDSLPLVVRTLLKKRNPFANREIIRAALERMTDQASLKYFAMRYFDSDLTDEFLMHEEIADEEPPFEERLTPPTFFARITDQQALFKIALSARGTYMRYYAAKQLTDQSLLEKLAKKSTEASMRVFAARRLKDQRTLAAIVLDQKEPLLSRALALDGLTDQRLLADIARKDHDEAIRRNAVKYRHPFRVNSTYSVGGRLNSFAVKKLTDQRLLEKLSTEGRCLLTCEFAKTRLAELYLLARANGNDSGVDITVATVGRLDDPHLLADLAVSTLRDDVRAAAVGKLADQRLLANVAGNLVGGGDIRLAAVEKLNDQLLLANIVKGGDNNFAIHKEMERRLFQHEMQMHLWVVMRTNHYPWHDQYYTNPALGWDYRNEIYQLNKEKDSNWLSDKAIGKICAENAAVRAAALRKLTDRQLLTDAAQNAAEEEARRLAEQRLKTISEP